MELINTTRLPAELKVSDFGSDPEHGRVRFGTLVAKATFDVNEGGSLRLSPDPLPVLEAEEEVELGILPRDFVPPRPEGLELMVLGAAHAPAGTRVTKMRVGLQVGEDFQRQLRVLGDRTWTQQDGEWVLSDPAPFERMPLSWDRTFGGTAAVWLDPSSAIDVQHPYNPHGRGFDPTPWADGIEETYGCAEGFPQIEYAWPAPNVERPDDRVVERGDQPEPCCWAPMPIELGLRAKPHEHMCEHAHGEARHDARQANVSRTLSDKESASEMWFAHPELRIKPPHAGEWIQLIGCQPSGTWAVRWPGLRVFGDYVISDRLGTRELQPQAAVLLPEQNQVVVTYRAWFRFGLLGAHDERSVRLRTDWETA